MSTVRSTEVCLRKQLLTKIFLNTLSHDNDEELTDEPVARETPSTLTNCLPDSTQLIGEQLAISEITGQNSLQSSIYHEVLKNNNVKFPETIEKKQNITYYKEKCPLSDFKCNVIDSHIVDSPRLIHSGSEAEDEVKCASFSRKCNLSKSEKRALKKYSKILNLIEEFERRIAMFCDKENEIPNNSSISSSGCDFLRLPYVKSSSQIKKYKKYHSKTSKVCKQLENQISLYSQYIKTLETAINSIPESSEIHKVLQAKVKSAQKFHLESPLHEEAKALLRQCRLISLLIKRFEKGSAA